jgi:bisphosphoglycerate-dependent phosphoglycerate mutase
MTETAKFWKPILSVTWSSPWHRYGDLQGLNKAETTTKFGEEQALGNVTPAIVVP